MSLSPDEVRDKVSTQLFEGGDNVRGKFVESYPCWPLSFQLMVLLSEPFNRYGKALHLPLRW